MSPRYAADQALAARAATIAARHVGCRTGFVDEDQTFRVQVRLARTPLIAGLGNIQVAEALFRARLSPSVIPAKVTPAQWRRLAAAIQESLRQALRVEKPGSDRDIAYVEEPGSANPFQVYGHAGDPCPRCRTPIRRSVQAQRSTFHCPRCQKS